MPVNAALASRGWQLIQIPTDGRATNFDPEQLPKPFEQPTLITVNLNCSRKGP